MTGLRPSDPEGDPSVERDSLAAFVRPFHRVEDALDLVRLGERGRERFARLDRREELVDMRNTVHEKLSGGQNIREYGQIRRPARPVPT